MMARVFFLCILLGVLVGQSFASTWGQNEEEEGFTGGDKQQRRSESDHDYEIYELIEQMNKLYPRHSTFYDLLGVRSGSSNEEISKQVRRLSFPYHPDKNSAPEAVPHFNLYTGAAQVLRNADTRRRYEWILHDAPPWHRSQVYFLHKLSTKRRRTSNSAGPELSVGGLFGLLVVILTSAQFIVQWVRFGVNRYWIWSGKRALKSIPAKEVRRMEKKAMKSDLTFLAYVDSNFENMQAARLQPLAYPLPTDLFILAAPLALIRWTLQGLKLRPKRD